MPGNAETLVKSIRISMIYMLVSIFVAFFGAVYEHFSFGVYSFYMIYAFAFPLIGGALVYLIKQMRDNGLGANKNRTGGVMISETLYHSAIATFTIGSIMKGVLDIYGTTNRLLIVYPVIGAVLLISAVVLRIRQSKYSQVHI